MGEANSLLGEFDAESHICSVPFFISQLLCGNGKACGFTMETNDSEYQPNSVCEPNSCATPFLQNGMKTHKTRDLMPILQALIHHTRASGSTEQVETRALSALLDVCDRTERIL